MYKQCGILSFYHFRCFYLFFIYIFLTLTRSSISKTFEKCEKYNLCIYCFQFIIFFFPFHIFTWKETKQFKWKRVGYQWMHAALFRSSIIELFSLIFIQIGVAKELFYYWFFIVVKINMVSYQIAVHLSLSLSFSFAILIYSF